MTAELITIGDEILIGQIVNSNAAFVGKELTKIGVELTQVKTIRDRASEILAAFESAQARADIVLVTGGLGPTNDDVTKKCLLDFFKDELVVDKESLAHIEQLFHQIGEPLLPANISQAQIPSKAEVLKNRYGTAPGMWFAEKETIFVAMPGVPYEMKAILTKEVIPRLKSQFSLPVILQQTILTYGVGESRVADRLSDWERELPQNMSLAYLPSPGRVRLRLTLKGEKESLLQRQMQEQLEKLQPLIGDIIGGVEGVYTPAKEIVQKLTAAHQSLATAESCTGGRIASAFIEIPGASAYFKGGLVPYAAAVKTNVLGVQQNTIDKHSTVSAQVAVEMARQAQKIFQTDFALATTGNAGPTKGDSDADIGTVFIALARKEKVEVQEFNFGSNREKITGKAVNKALEMLKNKLR